MRRSRENFDCSSAGELKVTHALAPVVMLVILLVRSYGQILSYLIVLHNITGTIF